MKIEYLRNMQFGYMRIETEEPLNKIEEKMLSHNVIEGILPLCWQQENDNYILRYDITGKQALDTLLSNRTLDEELLRILLSGICLVIRQLEKHLLMQNHLLLQPETIFWDNRNERMLFCYCPKEEGDIQNSFRRLMEYLLTKTDHTKAGAVELAYGVYEETLSEVFSLDDIQKKLEERHESVLVIEETVINEENSIAKIEEQEIKTGVEKAVAWIKEQMRKFIKRKTAENPVVFEPEPEEEEEKHNLPTVLLWEEEEKLEGVLKYEGRNSFPDIVIENVPFVIGSGADCDGIIERQTISRQHAKIYKIDGIYFIEDLNSTNGTRVDGGILSYKTKVSLKKNVCIHFANEPYRFL